MYIRDASSMQKLPTVSQPTSFFMDHIDLFFVKISRENPSYIVAQKFANNTYWVACVNRSPTSGDFIAVSNLPTIAIVTIHIAHQGIAKYVAIHSFRFSAYHTRFAMCSASHISLPFCRVKFSFYPNNVVTTLITSNIVSVERNCCNLIITHAEPHGFFCCATAVRAPKHNIKMPKRRSAFCFIALTLLF